MRVKGVFLLSLFKVTTGLPRPEDLTFNTFMSVDGTFYRLTYVVMDHFQDTAQNPDEQSHNELPHLVEGDIQPGDHLEDGDHSDQVQGEAGGVRTLVHQWHYHIIPYEVIRRKSKKPQGIIVKPNRLTGRGSKMPTDLGSK